MKLNQKSSSLATFTIFTILLLAIYDTLFSILLLPRFAGESNPAMCYFLERSVLAFVVAKASLTVLAAGIFYRYRKHMSHIALLGIFLVYGWVLVQHLELVGLLRSIGP